MEYYIRRISLKANNIIRSTVAEEGFLHFWVQAPSGMPALEYSEAPFSWNIKREIEILYVSKRCRQSEWEF